MQEHDAGIYFRLVSGNETSQNLKNIKEACGICYDEVKILHCTLSITIQSLLSIPTDSVQTKKSLSEESIERK